MAGSSISFWILSIAGSIKLLTVRILERHGTAISLLVYNIAAIGLYLWIAESYS